MNARDSKWCIVIEKNDVLNKKDIDQKKLIEYFTEENGFDFVAGILHDKDIDENGVLKTPHYHIYLELHNSYAKKTVINALAKYLMCNTQIIQCRLVKSVKQCVRYLTHADDKAKYQYKDENVFTTDIWKYENYFDYGNGVDVDVGYIFDLCKRSMTISEVYMVLGLAVATKHRNLIKDLFYETHGKKEKDYEN